MILWHRSLGVVPPTSSVSTGMTCTTDKGVFMLFFPTWHPLLWGGGLCAMLKIEATHSKWDLDRIRGLCLHRRVYTGSTRRIQRLHQIIFDAPCYWIQRRLRNWRCYCWCWIDPAFQLCYLLCCYDTLCRPSSLDGFRRAGNERGLAPGQASVHVVNFDLTPPTTKHTLLLTRSYWHWLMTVHTSGKF